MQQNGDNQAEQELLPIDIYYNKLLGKCTLFYIIFSRSTIWRPRT
jgi:hypothetical protein